MKEMPAEIALFDMSVVIAIIAVLIGILLSAVHRKDVSAGSS